jgi:ABC-2 type transport system ATP-binding protein
MIEIRHISKTYAFFPVVQDISFRASPGEVVGYLGPNGAGKSTTIKMLAGLLEPTSGEILFDGKNTRHDLVSYKKRLGYVPEQSEIYPHLSAWEYLLLVGRLRHIPEARLKSKIKEFLKLFGLAEDMDSPVSSYSKGMRQKVLLSAALIHNPDILLLDEPLSGLDVTTAMVIKDLVRALAAEKKTIIYSSHVLEVTEKICSRVIILHQGRIAANDTVENLRTLMKLPSLEKIFMELVIHEDTQGTARALVEAMKAGA